MKPHPAITEQGLPICTEDCPHHDGKRCEMMGFRPDRICEPAVLRIAPNARAEERKRCAEVCQTRAASHELVRSAELLHETAFEYRVMRDEAMRCSQAIENLEDP